MTLPYKEQIDIAKKICKSFAKSTGLPYENLFSECLDKIPRVNKNFIPELGKKFTPYLKTSLRGYLRNYVRDNSFTVKIPRRILDIYMKTKKFSSHYIAHLHTGYPLPDIRNAHETVSKYRVYNTQQLQSWTTPIHTFSHKNNFSECHQILNEASVDSALLLDHYVYKKSEEQLISCYGKNYKTKLTQDTGKLRTVCKQQGYA